MVRYREVTPPAALRGLVECAWTSSGGPGTRVLPDGCMDLLLSSSGELSVAGPDTAAFLTTGAPSWTAGVRFHPGALPRLLGVPAAELRNRREPLAAISPALSRSVSALLGTARGSAPRPDHGSDSRSASASAPGPPRGAEWSRFGAADETEPLEPLLGAVAQLAHSEPASRETAPWNLAALAHLTSRLAAGARVEALADELGWSSRSLTRQCTAVYGYGPATLRRILRFRAASTLLHAGVAPADAAVRTGYADQPHLTREFRALAGVTPATLHRRSSGADGGSVFAQTP